jgi:exo-beta-1,3-glucanase (GH17 family)/cellulose synthase/poly-beta-1,6-N-acetylglucosamine synthase-like glycosyltransferase
MKTVLQTLIGLALVIAANLSIWAWLNRPHEPGASWDGRIMGLSFSPMRRVHDPLQGRMPTPAEIEDDLAFLAGKVVAVRIYGVTSGLELVPDLAAKHGLNVTAGAWIGPDPARNERELRNLIRIGHDHRNVVRLLVGNEALLRGDVTVEELIGYVREVQKQVGRRVSTAEPWHVWLRHPELARTVDFIAVHILPYWEGVHVDDAVDYVFMRYDQLRRAYPDKPIILAEVGWPSAGSAIGQAIPSLVNQAKYLRTFLNAVEPTNIVYYVVEAFDQPWKLDHEGTAGAYWGIYHADRTPKFPMRGAVLPLPTWKQWAAIAVLLAMIPAMYFALRRQRVGTQGKVLVALVTNFAASGIAWSASIGASQYQTPLSAAVWIVLVLMQAIALLVLLAEAVEVAEVLWRHNAARDFQPLAPRPDYPYPKVSIHVPVHNEPPEMVRETLEALGRLDYPDYEVIVVDNNTKDPAVWQPVQSLCHELGPQFRFFHLERWPGYKAGALNFALWQTAPDAQIVAVIDSDYVVNPQWLKSLTPYFDNPRVGFVQAPQDYRDGNENLFKRMCYWEYAGFFHIGMVQRNDFNAIIQHGTMTLIRRTAVSRAGHWAEWCITEDAELGLRLLREGYDSVYVKESLGRGLMPDTLSAYKTQRFRWAYGAVQIMKRHLRALLPFSRMGLSASQKYYFVAGWVPWLSDGLALLFVLASLGLTVHMIGSQPAADPPIAALVFPILGIFTFKIIRSLWLYAAQVRCGFRNSIAALIAGLALTHIIGKAVLSGFTSSGRPFVRTPKLERGRPLLSAAAMIWEELLLLVMLLGAAWWVHSLDRFDNPQGRLWVIALLVQSVPYVAAVLMAAINVLSTLERQPAPAPRFRPMRTISD